jgi:hypothetical protein
MVLENSTEVRRVNTYEWRVGEDMGSKETDRCPLTGLELESDLIPSNIVNFGVFEKMLNLLWLDFLQHHHQGPLPILLYYC